MAAYNRTSTILKTAEIVSNIIADNTRDDSKYERKTKDAIRLSLLYGKGLRCVKKLKKARRLRVKEEILDIEFRPQKSSLESCHKKLFDSFELFELGVTALENDAERDRSVTELRNLLEYVLKLKLNVTEVVSLANELDCLEGIGKDSLVLMAKFLSGLKRIADMNRTTIRNSRRKEKEDCEIAKAHRAEYNLATFVKDPLQDFQQDEDLLFDSLRKLTAAAKKKRDMYPVFFEKLCHRYVCFA